MAAPKLVLKYPALQYYHRFTSHISQRAEIPIWHVSRAGTIKAILNVSPSNTGKPG